MTEVSSLRSSSGDTIVLKSVHLDGRLDGLMLRMKVQQRYRNETGKNMETVYTFPLAWGSTLLGMGVEIGGKHLQAAVVEKKQAAMTYEKAIEDGDMPVMVEQSSSGLYTANLGNLKDRESVTIEIEYVQLLRFEQGQVRLTIPTVIAPRFGDAHQPHGLGLYETDAVNPLAEYPLTLKVDIVGQIAKAKIACPSHRVLTAAIENGLSVTLERGAMLDRDFILNLGGVSGQSFAVSAPDGEQFITLASFCPQVPLKQAAPLLLKILVDCSGSMAGDSMDGAKRALHSILQELNADDCVSYSRFGDAVRHELNSLRACTPATVALVASAISQTDADMGGTNLREALVSTFKNIEVPSVALTKPGVLLITDGDVWDVDAIVQSATKHGQRIFAIGVGSSPAESLLRDLAEATGGACELVSPNEDISGAIMRMFRRMRCAHAINLKVEWGGATLWQSPVPTQIYDGETVHFFARTGQSPTTVPRLSFDVDGVTQHCDPLQMDVQSDATLARLGGAKHMSLAPPEEALALALKYQLVSPQSNLILVHVRADGDKALGLPELHQIEQMQAAGHGGFGTVMNYSRPHHQPAHAKAASHLMYRSVGHASVWERPSVYPTSIQPDMDDAEVPAFLRKMDDVPKPVTRPVTVVLLEKFDHAAVVGQGFTQALASMRTFETDANIKKILDAIKSEQISDGLAWALLLDWVAMLLAATVVLGPRAKRLLKLELAKVDAETKAAAHERIAQVLPKLQSKVWRSLGDTPLWRRISSRVKGALGLVE
jgi:Ca-activated chloride channel family protein